MRSELERAAVHAYMDAQTVANTLWALATLGWQAAEGSMMRSAMERAAERVASSMKPQEVADTLWALATLGWQAGEGSMRSVLVAAAERVAPSMKPQEVANMMWALATLGWQAGEGSMRSALMGAATRAISSMDSPGVASTLWAVATLGWQAGEGSMRSELVGMAVRVAPSMNAQDAAKTLWALETLGWQAGERAMRSALEGSPTSSSAQKANTLVSSVRLGSLDGLNRGCMRPICVCAECGGNGDLEFLIVCGFQHENCLNAVHSYCMRPPTAPTHPKCRGWRCMHCEERECAENAAVLEPASFEAEAPDWYARVRGRQRSSDHLSSSVQICVYVCVRLVY